MRMTFETALLAVMLVVVPTRVGQAQPSPDLMQSILSMRLEASREARSKPAGRSVINSCVNCPHSPATHTMTAGQGSVTVPLAPARCQR